MHGYCTDQESERRRKTIIGIMVTASVALTPLINCLIKILVAYVKTKQTLVTVLDWLVSNGFSFAVSYVAVFSFLYWLLNKLFPLRPISSIVGIPCIRGTWSGKLHSNYNGATDIDMSLVVKQSWMRIRCTAFFDKSSSDSIMARVYQQNKNEIRFEFAYRNESQDASVTQRDYYGFNYFVVRGDTMKGSYFTNRKSSPDIFTHGYIELTKVHGTIWKYLHRQAKPKQIATQSSDTSQK